MLRFLVRNGIRKGFLGGSRPWAVVGGLALGGRALKRLASPKPEVVYCEKIEPGQSLLITRESPHRRAGRKHRTR
ncbi:MAG: hypothetical protein ACRDZW_08050 [Acidimicrobiales bacterium]